MYIGGSLFLLAIGAILAFAVQDAVSGVDLTMVGYILMGVAVLGIVFSFFLMGQQRTRRDDRGVPPREY